MNPNLTPTELEIQMHAVAMFPENELLQSSFIQGVWHTVYNLKSKTSKNEH